MAQNFKLIKTLQEVNDTNRGKVALVEMHEYKGKVFKFRFENSNGDPCGFDYKHAVRVFNKEQDEWKNLGDKSDINAFAAQPINYADYYGNGAKIMRDAKAFMEACKGYVVALYGK